MIYQGTKDIVHPITPQWRETPMLQDETKAPPSLGRRIMKDLLTLSRSTERARKAEHKSRSNGEVISQVYSRVKAGAKAIEAGAGVFLHART